LKNQRFFQTSAGMTRSKAQWRAKQRTVRGGYLVV